MKVFGWILVAIAVLLIVCMIASADEASAELMGPPISAVLTCGVLGAYLIHRGNQKKKEEEEEMRDTWGKE
jgi:hypothetical protein